MDDATIAHRFRLLEARVAQLEQMVGLPPTVVGEAPAGAPVALPPEVMDLVNQGKTMDAIAALRRSAGLSLAEAKALIDQATGAPG